MLMLGKKKLCFNILLVCFLVIVTMARTGVAYSDDLMNDTYDNRVAAVKEYLKITPVEKMMKDATLELSKTLPKDSQKEYFNLVMSSIETEKLEKATLDSMTKVFTLAEIKALNKFYSSKEGNSVMRKIGVYMADIMPVIQEELQKAHISAIKKLKSEDKGK